MKKGLMGRLDLIEVEHLTKRYGSHVAVEDLSFTVEKSEICGLLGPNGAGKSTTMNILTGYLSATEGTVRIDGIDIFEEPEKAKRKIGYLPEIPPLYTDMTPMEYLRFVTALRKIPRKRREELIEAAVEKTDIRPVCGWLIRNLSKGYRQRVGLAAALAADPSVIILDEPTVGLDPKQIIEIRELIRELGRDHTVLLSSHILSEVSAVCGKVLIMSHGKCVAYDTPEHLEQRAHHVRAGHRPPRGDQPRAREGGHRRDRAAHGDDEPRGRVPRADAAGRAGGRGRGHRRRHSARRERPRRAARPRRAERRRDRRRG